MSTCPWLLYLRKGTPDCSRHNAVKYELPKLLEAKGFTCLDEVGCKDHCGRNRRIDILAFKEGESKAYIIDPTIRFETNEDLDKTVQSDKNKIYRGCAADLAQRFQGKRLVEFEVIGLWWGARGTVGPSVLEFFMRFDLPKKRIVWLTEMVMTASLNLLHQHIYGVP